MFWRLTTRTDSALGPNVSPTWVLYIEPAMCPASPFVVRGDDYDGDGASDTVRAELRAVVIIHSSGVPPRTLALPANGEVGPFGWISYFLDPAGSGIGDTSGDGYGDFAWQYSTDTYAGVSIQHSRAWYEMLGGPAGLGTWSGRQEGSGAAAYAPPIVTRAIGDIDRDGYGDIATSTAADPYPSLRNVRYVTRAGGAWAIPGTCDLSSFFELDVNGDSVLDVAVQRCTGGPHLFVGDAALRRFGSGVLLPGCDSLLVRPGTSQIVDVRDVNCDGLSDLIAQSGVPFVLFGGPDGLSSTRCAALPATP